MKKIIQAARVEVAPRSFRGWCSMLGHRVDVEGTLERVIVSFPDTPDVPDIISEYRIRALADRYPDALHKYIQHLKMSCANLWQGLATEINFGTFTIRCRLVGMQGEMVSTDPPSSEESPEVLWAMAGGNP